MFFIYLAVLSTAVYWVVKTLAPEMAKPPMPNIPAKTKSPNITPTHEYERRIKKLETLLAEKNRNITLLQTELKIFHIQVRDFDAIKSMLEEEIHRLREQNRIFRSELGLPSGQNQHKENSIK